jgi:hypothetical protein
MSDILTNEAHPDQQPTPGEADVDFDPSEMINMLMTDSDIFEKELAGLDEDQLVELRQKMNPFACQIAGTEDKVMCMSIINVDEKFRSRFLATSLIGYLHRALGEWLTVDGQKVVHPGTLPSIDEMDAEEVVEGEMPKYTEADRRRRIVYDFLIEMLGYNPDIHVRSAYAINRDGVDRERKHLATVKGVPVPKPEEGKDEYNRVMSLVPSGDAFHRWKYYMDANYEELREATVDLYAEQPDVEFMVHPYAEFPNDKKAKDFVAKHKNDVIADIERMSSGKWNIMGSFKENRKRVEFFNENTRVLEAMLEQNKRDVQMGEQLMKKRVSRRRKENIAKEGPHADGLASYSAMAGTGGEHVKDDPTLAYQEDYDPCPDDAVQIDVINISAGGENLKKGEMFIEAAPPGQ